MTYAAISAFALHTWDNHHTAKIELTGQETEQELYEHECRVHKTNELIDYCTHRTTIAAKMDLLADWCSK